MASSLNHLAFHDLGKYPWPPGTIILDLGYTKLFEVVHAKMSNSCLQNMGWEVSESQKRKRWKKACSHIVGNDTFVI